MIWDIVKPRDEWERNFAKLEYLRIGMFKLRGRQIEVTDEDDELIKILDSWLRPSCIFCGHYGADMCGRCEHEMDADND